MPAQGHKVFVACTFHVGDCSLSLLGNGARHETSKLALQITKKARSVGVAQCVRDDAWRVKPLNRPSSWQQQVNSH